jgi:hypothetical protein
MAARKTSQRKTNVEPSRSRRVKPRLRASTAGSRVGDDLVAAFEEMAAHMRGEIELEEVALPSKRHR